MPLQIQSLAKGLVGLLELNTDGRGPMVMSDVVAGIVDLRELFLFGKHERLQSTATAAGTSAGDFSFAGTGLTVPNNEAWWVLHYCISATVPLGLVAQISPTYQVGGFACTVGDAQQNGSSALASVLRVPARYPFIIPPGGAPAGITHSLSAATAFSAFGNIDFVRFRL